MNLYWSLSQPILVVITTNIGHDTKLYRSARRPIWVRPPLSIEMDFNLREVGHKESPEVV